MTVLDISEFVKPAPAVAAELRWNLGDYIEHWSPSSIAMFQRCAYQWQQRYIHKRKERPAEATTTGTTVHRGVERNMRQKIESHVDLPTADLLDWYSDEGFKAVVEAEQEKAGVEVLWDTSEQKAHDRGRAMLAAYHGEVAPRVQPTNVEERIELLIGLPVPVIGIYDVRREGAVIDVKTGKRKQTKAREDWRIQAAVYGIATGEPVEFHSVTSDPKRVRPSVDIVTPLESEAMLIRTTEREQKQISRDIFAISAVACLYMEMYGPDTPWPLYGRFHTWACDYCGFRPTCPAWTER